MQPIRAIDPENGAPLFWERPNGWLASGRPHPHQHHPHHPICLCVHTNHGTTHSHMTMTIMHVTMSCMPSDASTSPGIHARWCKSILEERGGASCGCAGRWSNFKYGTIKHLFYTSFDFVWMSSSFINIGWKFLHNDTYLKGMTRHKNAITYVADIT